MQTIQKGNFYMLPNKNTKNMSQLNQDILHMNRLHEARIKFQDDGFLFRKKINKKVEICDFLGFPLRNLLFETERDFEIFLIYAMEKNINLFKLSKYPMLLKLHLRLACIKDGVKDEL